MQRKFVLWTVALALLTLQAGCSFKLRSSEPWPEHLQPVAFENRGAAPDLAAAFEKRLKEKGVKLGSGGAIVSYGGESIERKASALNSQGKATEYTLNYRATIQLSDAKNRVLLSRTRHFSRSYAFDPANALGYERQERSMVEAMRQQAIDQLLREIARVPSKPEEQ